jgi:predicted MPP superfamily phosphohydrolase
MIVFFSVFFVVYTAINYYIFIRGWQALSAYPQLKIIYLVLFLVLSLSYIVSKILTERLPSFLYDTLQWIGSFWFAFMLYFILSIVLLDLLRLFNHFFSIFPAAIVNNYGAWKFGTFIIVLVLTSAMVAAGYINTRILNVQNLEVTLKKGSSHLTELNVVMFADIHLTAMNNEKLLSRIIDRTNALNPDIVLIPGDFVDEKSDWYQKRGIGESFFRIKSRYGVYACTGNHEYITGIKDASGFIRSHNINLLQDEMVMVDSAFYIAGRDDRSKKQFTGQDRKSLNEIVSTRDEELPLILLDHTPFGLEEAENNNVDLQLSGHTHHAQLWPLNFLTQMIYEKDYGYLKKGNTQYYVTCGVGTWGPPVRTGSRTEIVNLKIKFE